MQHNKSLKTRKMSNASAATGAAAACWPQGANLKKHLNSMILLMLIHASTATSVTPSPTGSGPFNYLQPRRTSATLPSFSAEDRAIVLDAESLYKPALRPATSRHKRAASTIVDSCQSRMEVLTPYHATNSKGELRTLVNSEIMQQAIQVETCLRSSSVQANRCSAQADCGCEQKYKWHRLLVLDPSGDAGPAKGLFMDWFLFPSNCVCRCKSAPGSTRHFLRTIALKQ